MYGKALKGSAAVPAATFLPQLGNGNMGTVMAIAGCVLMVALLFTSILAHKQWIYLRYLIKGDPTKNVLTFWFQFPLFI